MSFTLPKNVSMNLSKYPRSILEQFRCGVLPTKVVKMKLHNREFVSFVLEYHFCYIVKKK